jgi:hypothetical protein
MLSQQLSGLIDAMGDGADASERLGYSTVRVVRNTGTAHRSLMSERRISGAAIRDLYVY